MMKLSKKMAIIWLLMPALTFAQDDFWYQRDFPKEEFAQRRAKVFEKIGTEAVALLQGTPSIRGFGTFRQNNEFYYLCGIEVPQAYLLLDGRSGKTAVYLPSLSRRRRSGPTATEVGTASVDRLGRAGKTASVEMSPNVFLSVSPAAILRRIRRMILPDLVLGRSGTTCRKSGLAIGPISVRTCPIRVLRRSSLSSAVPRRMT